MDEPNQDIADPFGGDSEAYEACAQQIEALVQKLAAKLEEKPE